MSSSGRCEVPGRRAMARAQTVGGPHWALPAGHLAAAALAQVAAALVLVAIAGDLADGRWYGPGQLAAAHLYGLATLSVAIAGVLLQLVPVVVRQAVPAPTAAGAAGAALLAGGAATALGLGANVRFFIASGTTLVVIGLLTVLALVGTALVRAARARTLGDAGLGIAVALAWIPVVVGTGATLAAARIEPGLGIPWLKLLGAHVTAALVGWVGGMIVALSLRLAPMFALAHAVPRPLGRAAVGIWHAGAVALALGLGLGSGEAALAGLGLLALASLAALGFVAGVIRARRRRLEAPVAHLAFGLAAATIGAAALLVVAARDGRPEPHALAVAILGGLVALGAGATSGHVFKILPMVVWVGRHAARAGTPGVPRLTEMYPQSLARAEQAVFAVGAAALLIGVGGGRPALATAGAIAIAAAAVLVLVAGAVVLVPALGRAEAGAPVEAPASR